MNDQIEPRRLTPSPAIADQARYAVPRHAAPIDLKLDGNEGSGPGAELLATLAGGDPEHLLRRYPNARELEELLAERLGLSAEQILVTAGADDALDRACRALLAPGRELVMPVPTFEMLPRYARLAGAAIREVAWPDGAYPLEAVVSSLSSATAAIAVVSPNNPTGAVATADDLRRLAAAAPGAALLVDLAYGEFADEDLTEVALSLPHALVFRTLSKAWGLAGCRVGYVAGPAWLIDWLRRAGNPYAVAAPSLALAAERLRSGQGAMARQVALVRREREGLRHTLESLGLQAPASQGNFVLARCRDAAWLRDGLAGLGIAVRGWPGDSRLGSSVRITCPANDAAYRRLVASIAAVLSPEALLFDMDGVLADVSGSYRRAIVETAASFGVDLGLEDIARSKAAGDANNDWILTQRLLAERGSEQPLELVTERFERIYLGDDQRPGLDLQESLLCDPAWLRRLASRLPLAVVTGRPRAQAVSFLERQGVSECFSALVCMEDAPAKPAARPVELALEQLEVGRAWLVGDTPDDMRAARGATVVPIGAVLDASLSEAKRAQTASSLSGSGAARVLDRLDTLEEMLP